MSFVRILSAATALFIAFLTARADAAGEVQFLRAQASHGLGRTPFERRTFEILVKNLAYDKHVTLHLNVGSGIWTDYDCSYVRSVDSQTELWQLTFFEYEPTPTDTATNTFSIKYEVAGMTFVDDNGGKNYTMHVDEDGLLLTAPVLLSQAGTYKFGPTVYSFSGAIDVQNLAYAKKVTVVYTSDNWLTVQSSPATYALNMFDNGEQWYFSTMVASLPVQFAIAYEVGGITYWDNNFGQNYSTEGL